MTPQLSDYLILAAIVFSIGLAGVLSRRNTIIILIGIEMMLNAANINFVAFARFLNTSPDAVQISRALTGQMFTIFSIAIAGAEAAVGLALVIAMYRHLKTVDVESYHQLNG